MVHLSYQLDGSEVKRHVSGGSAEAISGKMVVKERRRSLGLGSSFGWVAPQEEVL